MNDLSYKILKYPTRELNKTQTDTEIKKAFDQWSDVTPLKFIQIYSGTVSKKKIFNFLLNLN